MPPPKTSDAPAWATRRRRWGEDALRLFFLACAGFSVMVTIGIVAVLLVETVAFFREVSLISFLTDRHWTPLFTRKEYGVGVLVSATLLTTAIALIVALPLGLLAAVFLSEYASPRLRRSIKPALEVLAGIPTVVFGYFALLWVTPHLRLIVPGLAGFNSLSAGIVMGAMIIPTIASLSEDAMYAVPRSLREGAYSLGATRREVVTGVVLPAALSGIVAAFILGVSRAIGETMIVSIAAGQNPRLTLNPLVPVQTMTSYIVQVSLGDTPTGTLAFKTVFAVGMTLFLMTLTLNVLSHWIVRRYREAYA